MVGLGGPPVPSPGQPLEELLPALEADLRAITAELDVAVLTPALDLPPGGSGSWPCGSPPGPPRRSAARRSSDLPVRQLAGGPSMDA